MTPTKTAVRSGAIDAVRVAGILAVVAGHTLATPAVRPLFYTWHVPLFFFLAGYFWSHRRGLAQEVRKRGRTLMLPYVTWFVLLAVGFVALDPLLESTTWRRLTLPLRNGQHSAMPFTTFWFVSVLFVCCVLMRMLAHLPAVWMWAIGVAAAVAGWMFGPQLAATPLSVGSALPCLIFILFGSLARTVHDRYVTPERAGAAALIALAATAVCGAGVAVGAVLPADIKVGDFGTPIMSRLTAMVIAFTMVLTAEWLFARLPHRASVIVTQLSYGGLMVVLTHPFLWWLSEHFFPPMPSWIVFVACVVIPWAAALLALRTRFSLWLTGVPRVQVAAAVA